MSKKMKSRSPLVNNVSWIFVGNVLHAIFQFLINVFVARFLSESEYGIINYSISFVALFLAISTIGFNGVITKKFAENENDAGKYIMSAIVFRLLVSIFSIFLIQFVAYIHNSDDVNIRTILFVQSFLILFSSGDLLIYWYRFKYNAKIVSILRIIVFSIMAVWRIISLVVFHSIILYVFGTVFEIGLLVLFLLFIYIKTKQPRLSFSINHLKSLIRISYPFIFSAILTTIYGQVDKLMLESMINIESVAYYSVSLTLAGAIAIIPIALIEGYRPDILRNKEINENAYVSRLKQLYFLVFWSSIAYCTFITLFAQPIINIVYGDAYLPAAPALALIVWYTSFSYFGAINNIYMVAENKARWIQLITFSGAVLNVALNLLLIPSYDIRGAAGASLITQFFINFILLLLIKPLRQNFVIIFTGIFDFRWILPYLKK